ncbi:MAG: hypothetical protein JSU92_04410 [Deltaproteobacteria bacterium]|nr:MAG: hypothetical protein JSU92_04410 [Deltaproteobacteria bacterium]
MKKLNLLAVVAATLVVAWTLSCGDDDGNGGGGTNSWEVILVSAFAPNSGNTEGGIGVNSTEAEVVAEFGEPEDIEDGDYWYNTKGIMFSFVTNVYMVGVFEPIGGLPSADNADIVPGLKVAPIYLRVTYAEVKSELGSPDEEDCESVPSTCAFAYIEEGIGGAVLDPAKLATGAGVSAMDRKAELKDKVEKLFE